MKTSELINKFSNVVIPRGQYLEKYLVVNDENN